MKSKLLIFTVILFVGCNPFNEDNKEYSIKGTLLQSCDNPTPVTGVKLILDYDCNCSSSKILQEVYTDSEGKFEFNYKTVAGNDIVIRGTQANGGGTKNYLFGIPINKDLDIGNLYNNDNFFAIVKLEVSRPTSLNDTLFYDEYGAGNFRKSLLGPFNNGLILDTLRYRNAQFYDLDNKQYYKNISHAFYSWKIGKRGVYNSIWTLHKPCLKYNYYVLEIK